MKLLHKNHQRRCQQALRYHIYNEQKTKIRDEQSWHGAEPLSQRIDGRDDVTFPVIAGTGCCNRPLQNRMYSSMLVTLG